ncbi:MAG: hypothetical protein DI632_13985 [Sphingomonas hengshuiensis]|uniref:Uncharacterized protein n=1 Tax=Sphingomonas hengshuiensis TaxID=1609977 RepID=A0A2W5B0H1_9SPHN|nr:MAG: hypothetical protein DI632_13985 [Sphingomonas hengshuiensis]
MKKKNSFAASIALIFSGMSVLARNASSQFMKAPVGEISWRYLSRRSGSVERLIALWIDRV